MNLFMLRDVVASSSSDDCHPCCHHTCLLSGSGAGQLLVAIIATSCILGVLYHSYCCY